MLPYAIDRLARALYTQRKMAPAHQGEGASALDDASGFHQLLQQGEALLTASDYAGAQQLFDQALRLAVAADDAKGEVLTLRALLKCAFYRHDHDGALALGERVIERAREAGLRKQEALGCNDLGIIYGYLKRYAEAIGFLVESARLLRALGDDDLNRPLINLGNIYYDMEDFDKALEAYQEAYRLLPAKIERTHGIVLGNIGRTRQALGRYAEAEKHLQESLAVFEALRDSAYSAAARLRLGQLYLATGALGQAHDHVAASLSPMPSGAPMPWRDEALLVLGQLQLRLGDLDRAQDSLNAALAAAEQQQANGTLAEAYRALADIHERRGDLAGALQHFKAFVRHYEGLLHDKADRASRAALVAFEVDRVKRERARYQRRNAELLELQRQLETQNARLRELALRDPLTSLRNRRYLEDYLDDALSRAERYGHTFSLIVLDIDHFKQINDTYSHTVGDDVLVAMARLLTGQLRHADIIARYGGEEFIIVLPETGPSQALVTAEKLRQAVENYPWHTLARGLAVTISCGVTAYNPGTSLEALLQLADRALYRAKGDGRNRVYAAPRDGAEHR